MLNNLVATLPKNAPPIDRYYIGRNGNVARHIANSLGQDYLGMIPHDNSFIARAIDNSVYTVLAKPVDLDLLNDAQVNNNEAVYGGAFADPKLTDKTTLHPGVDGKPVYDSIDSQFQRDIAGVVLPGYSVTNVDQIHAAFQLLHQQGIHQIRLKDASSSDGKNQYVVCTADEAVALFRSAQMQAAVLEQQVAMPDGSIPQNISVGIIELPNVGQFSILSTQIDIPLENGRIMYGGANCVLIRGGLAAMQSHYPQIADLNGTDPTLAYSSIANSQVFLNSLLGSHECLVSRITVDTLQSKICDISCRVTGSDPFVQVAVQELMHNPDSQIVEGFVHLNYDYAQFEDPAAVSTFLFHHDPQFPNHDLQITAGVRTLI